MAAVDIPEAPRDQRYDWSGYAAADTLDEIERRFSNLFVHGRGWTSIGWYEHTWTNAPEVEPGLFLDDDPRNFQEAIRREGDHGVTVALTQSRVCASPTPKRTTSRSPRSPETPETPETQAPPFRQPENRTTTPGEAL